MSDLISVIIPVYNSEETIERTIQSVLSQTYTHLQIIIVDDCSKDQSVHLIKRMAQEDARIEYYVNSKNQGVSQTRNFACSKAKGKYIAFLDSDDEWYVEKLQLQLSYLKQFEADMCYTAYEMIEKSNHLVCKRCSVPSQITYKELLKENVICCSTLLLKKELLDQRPFREEYFHEDFILWLQLLKKGAKATGLQEYLVAYTKGGRSSDKVNAMYYRWQIYRKVEQLPIISALYYFIFYGINGVRKYYINNRTQDQKSYEETRKLEH